MSKRFQLEHGMLSTTNVTIESVHGLKETVVISRDGIRPAATHAALTKKNSDGEELRRPSEAAEPR